MILGTNIEVGHKLLTQQGWRKVLQKTDTGVILNKGQFIKFGEEVLGWKIN